MAATKPKADPDTVFSLLGNATRQLLQGGLGAVGALDEARGTLLRGLSDTGTRTAGAALRNADNLARTIVRRVWTQAEELFELRATRLLNTLQIPTHRDVNELATQVENLSAEVARLRESRAEGKPAGAKSTPRKARKKTTSGRAASTTVKRATRKSAARAGGKPA